MGNIVLRYLTDTFAHHHWWPFSHLTQLSNHKKVVTLSLASRRLSVARVPLALKAVLGQVDQADRACRCMRKRLCAVTGTPSCRLFPSRDCQVGC